MVKTVILWLAALGLAYAEPVTLAWDIPTSNWDGKNVDVLVEVSTNQQTWAYVGCQPDQTVNTVQVNAPDARPKWFRVRAIQADVLDCDAASALASSVYSDVVAQALLKYDAVSVTHRPPWTYDQTGPPPLNLTIGDTPDFWWKLNETTGTVVANSGKFGTPVNYNGTVRQYGGGGAYAWLGQGYMWGSGQWPVSGGILLTPATQSSGFVVDINTRLPLSNVQKLTVTAWVTMTASPGDGRIFAQNLSDAAAGSHVMLGETADGTPRVRLYASGGATTTIANGSIKFSTQQRHVAIVLDGSLATGKIKIYVNGALHHSANFSGSTLAAETVFSPVSSIRAMIGGAASSNANLTQISNAWHGSIADVRVWLAAATATDVQKIYGGL